MTTRFRVRSDGTKGCFGMSDNSDTAPGVPGGKHRQNPDRPSKRSHTMSKTKSNGKATKSEPSDLDTIRDTVEQAG